MKGRIGRKILFLSLLVASMIFQFPFIASASESTVSSVTELKNAIEIANSGDVIKLNENFVFDDLIIEMPNADVIIDGSGLTWNTGKTEIKGEGSGSITIKNLKYDGANIAGKIILLNNTNGTVNFENIEFFNSTKGVMEVSTGESSNISLKRVWIHDNTANNTAPAIQLGENANVEIFNSTIENNRGTGGGEATGTIAGRSYKGNLDINNSVFRNNVNESVNTGTLGGGGGAISLHYYFGHTNIVNSIFDGNSSSSNVSKSSDGGAIYVLDGHDNATFNVEGSTFMNNIAYDDGGALFLQGTGNPGLITKIVNSTFYNNRAYALITTENMTNQFSGGAIMYVKNGGSAKMTNTILSSTFVGNQVGNDKTSIEQRGGAVALNGFGIFASAAVTRNDSLFIDNSVYGADGEINTASNYKDISNFATVQAGQGKANVINVDKGANPAYSNRDVMGREDIQLVENKSKIVAGFVDEIIKTIPIKPEGIADNGNSGTTAQPDEDQRGAQRYKDYGAVEMSWIKYVANGGYYDISKADLPPYIGDEYYNTNNEDNIIDYFTIGVISEVETIINHEEKKLVNDDKTFLGWSTDKDATEPDKDANGNVKYLVGNNVTYDEENLVLYAIWQGPKYTITYDANGGLGDVPVDEESPYLMDTKVIVMDKGNLYNEKLAFKEWNTAADGSGISHTAGTELIIKGDTILYAIWREPYTVTYDGNGATSGSVQDTNKYFSGDKFLVMSNEDGYIREHYTFITWEDKDGNAYKTSDEVEITDNVILYATWQEDESFTLSYDANGGNGQVPIDDGKYYENQKATVKANIDLIKDGYKFGGWNTKADGNGDNFTENDKITITEDTILYAKWNEIPKYDVLYNGNGHTDGDEPIDGNSPYLEDSLITVLDKGNLEKTGYEFIEWNTEADGSGTSYSPGDTVNATFNGSFYAQWAKVNNVTFNPDGGVFEDGTVEQKVVRVISTHTVSSETVSKANYVFLGWYLGDELYEFDLPVISDIELVAHWSENEKYTVKYDGNGSTGGVVPNDTNEYYEENTVVVLEGEPVRENYNFSGWTTSADGSGTTYQAGDTLTITENTTLYAKWDIPTPGEIFRVKYDGNGHTGGVVPNDVSRYFKGDTVVVLEGEPVRENYIFSAWNTSADGSGTTYQAGDNFTITENITLYAKWDIPTPGEIFRVKYDGNGHTGGVVPNDVSRYFDGDTVVVLEGEPVRENYIFSGWNTSADGSGTTYQAGDNFTITENITLYAKWDIPTPGEIFRVKYDGNGHTGGVVPNDVSRYFDGDTVVVLEGEPVRENYIFSGWNTSADGSGTTYQAGDTLTITENITLYAQWKKTAEKPEEEKEKPVDYNSIIWNWHGEPVEIPTSVHRAYMSGYPDGTIRAKAEITRGEVAAIISRLHVDVEEIDYGVDTKYSDVKPTDWYAKHISYVSDKGLMEGYEDGSFKPEEKITRAEYATVIARFKALVQEDTNFVDSKGHWAKGNIGALEKSKWINGYPDGTFRPEDNITREEVATITNKMLDRKVDREGLESYNINKFVDLEFGTWSYFDLLEATNTHDYNRRSEHELVEDWK